MRKLILLFVPLLFIACGSNDKPQIAVSNSESPIETSKIEYIPLDTTKYKIIGTDHNNAVENYYILIKGIVIDKDTLQIFVDKFRNEKCKNKCNINIIDSKEIYPLIQKYPLKGKEYITVADHFVAMSDFDTYSVWMYPYQDIQYKEFGGKNWKKESIK